MARSKEVQERFSEELGIDIKRVTEVTARIRPHGYFVTETKSKLTHRVTARHCANLLYALMSDAPANSTPDALKEAEQIYCSTTNIPGIEVFDAAFDGTFSRLCNPHTIIDGIELFFNMASAKSELFDFFFVGKLNEATFETNNYHFCEFNLPINWASIYYAATGEWLSPEALEGKGYPPFQMSSIAYESGVYSKPDGPTPPKMEKITRIWLKTFLKIGELLRESGSG